MGVAVKIPVYAADPRVEERLRKKREKQRLYDRKRRADGARRTRASPTREPVALRTFVPAQDISSALTPAMAPRSAAMDAFVMPSGSTGPLRADEAVTRVPQDGRARLAQARPTSADSPSALSKPAPRSASERLMTVNVPTGSLPGTISVRTLPAGALPAAAAAAAAAAATAPLSDPASDTSSRPESLDAAPALDSSFSSEPSYSPLRYESHSRRHADMLVDIHSDASLAPRIQRASAAAAAAAAASSPALVMPRSTTTSPQRAQWLSFSSSLPSSPLSVKTEAYEEPMLATPYLCL